METQWQPIETAPQDGTPIVIYHDGLSKNRDKCDVTADFVVAEWRFDRWCTDIVELELGYYGDASLSNVYIYPTHWMPIPPAPTAQP